MRPAAPRGVCWTVRRIDPPGQLIDVGGYRLHLFCSGQGSPAIVLDAALGGSSVSWSLVQPEISRLSRVCSYDRAGFGWSDAGPLPRTAGRIAGELRTLLERAGVDPPFLLVGHSFGGLVALIFARRFLHDTLGLVLVDPAHAEDWVMPAPKEQLRIDKGIRLCRYGQAAARLGLARAVVALISVGRLGLARSLARIAGRGDLSAEDESILAPVWKLPPEARAPLPQFWTRPHFFESLGSQIASMCVSAAEAADAMTGGYGDLPLTTISSTDPGEYRRRQQDALAALSTRGRHVKASQSGHWIPLDQPEVIVEAVQDMLTSLHT